MVKTLFFKKTKVNAGADIGMLKILESVTYTPAQAIAEYVDNSVQSYFDNKKELLKINPNFKLRIDITVIKKTITITDNAAGISDQDLERSLTTASVVSNSKSKSLNEFGMGMKSASYWFTRTWSIETKSIKEKNRKVINFDLEKVIASNGQVDVNRASDNNKKSGTIITLKNVRQYVTRHNTVIEELGSTHRKFLSNNEIIITYTHPKEKNIIAWENPAFRKEPPYGPYQKWINENKDDLNSITAKKTKPKSITWCLPVEVEFGVETKMKAKGYVAKMDKQLKKISGLYLFRRNKLLEGPYFPAEMFPRGQSDGTSTANAIYGELDIEGANAVFTKNALNITDRDRQDFELKLKKLLRDELQNCGSNLLSQLRIPNKEFEELYLQEKLLADGKIKGAELEDLKNSQKYHGIDAANKAILKNKDNPGFSKPPNNPLPSFKGKTVLNDPIKGIKIGNKRYTFKLEQTWTELQSDPWLDYQINDSKKEITIRIAMEHPFFTHYFFSDKKNDRIQGIKLLGQYIVNAEVTALEEGIKRSRVVRENINKILYELPPLVGKKQVGKKEK